MRNHPLKLLTIFLIIIITAYAITRPGTSEPLKQFIGELFGNPKKTKRAHPKFVRNTDKQYYFVDQKRGNDSNPGTKEKPWKTVNKAAFAKPRKLGTEIIFRKGRYRGSLNPQSNGLKTAWLSFRAYPGEKAVIDGSSSRNPGVDLSGKSYIRIEDLGITNFAGDGVAIDSKYGQHHLIVSNCTISNVAASGIRIKYATNVGIIKNRIKNTGKYGIADKGHSRHILLAENDISFPGIDCIYISSPHLTVDSNYLHDNSKPVDAHEHADGIQVFIDLDDYNKDAEAKPQAIIQPPNTGIIIRNNVIQLNVDRRNDSIQSNSMMLENAGNLEIYNNVVIGSGTSNVLDVKNCPDSNIFNNTLVGSKHQGIYVHNGSNRCRVYNNFVFSSKGQSLLVTEDSTNGFISDHNIFSSPIKWGRSIMELKEFTILTGHDRHSKYVVSEPGFIDRKNYNLRITKSSPAFNGGFKNINSIIRYPKHDIDGKPRRLKGSIDIGAYECESSK